MFIDTHCHLGKDDYEDVNQIINNMDNNIMIASGVDLETNKEVIELISKYSNVYGTLGFHPEYANEKNINQWIKYMEENVANPKIVGIGEVGLDYHYEGFDKIKQKELFLKMITLSKKYKKTLIIHTRDACQDTFDILKEVDISNINVTLHCFSESLEMAKEFIKLGCKLGVGGVVTFKNGRKLQEVVSSLDLSNFVLETDSPYMAPEPYRGTKNEPKNVYLVAKKIAELKNISIDDVIKITTENAKKQYHLEDLNEL